MLSIQSRLVRTILVKGVLKKLLDPSYTSLEKMRASAKLTKMPSQTKITEVLIDGLPVEWIRTGKYPQTGKQKAILYFHPGAFCLGYSNVHRKMASIISDVAGFDVLAVNYRLAPEYPYPACVEDGVKAYRWLLVQGFNPGDIVLCGDSCGGGLVLMTLLALRDAEEKKPAGACILCPMGCDLTYFEGQSYTTYEKSDPLNTKRGIQMFADIFFDKNSKRPEAPIFQDLSGLPRLLIQPGGDNIMLSDSIRLAEKAKAAGVDVTFDVWDDMWHDFQGFAPILPEGMRALRKVGDFIRNCYNNIP